MKDASPALIALLAGGVFCMADCFTITLIDGTSYYYTSADVPVTIGTTVFLANSVRVSGLKFSMQRGVNVDEQTISIAATSADLIEGLPFLQAIRQGALDGAQITRQRAFLTAWGTPAVGAPILFYGGVSTVEKLGRTSAQVKVQSETRWLARDFPRNLYRPTCQWTLYGYGCGLNKASYAVNATVAAGSTSQVILLTGVSDGTTFSQGTITFTGGLLSGVSATVRTGGAGPASVSLAAGLLEAPNTGDTITLYPGCDRTLGAQGCAKFSNQAQFRGFKNVPPPASGL